MFKNFFFPEFNRKFCLRICITGIVVWGICYFFFMPCFINGDSMQPAYDSTGFNSCNTNTQTELSIEFRKEEILKHTEPTSVRKIL